MDFERDDQKQVTGCPNLRKRETITVSSPGVASRGEAHSLIGSSAEIAAKLTALKAQGVAYVLLFGQGSRENMRRFAETVMPGFAAA